VEERLVEVLPREGPGRLAEAMRYAVLAGGKRLRPGLVMASCELLGGSSADAVDAACAVEMVHAFSLIHDDLPAMDDGLVRHGRPTCHRTFGEAVAILAGDALLVLAFETICRSPLPTEARSELVKELALAAGPSGMAVGQAADLAFSGRDELDEGAIEFIHANKTARLISASVKMGAICANAANEDVERLGRFGHNLGMAFQLADDILDAVGTENALGKDAGKDADLSRPSYTVRFGLEAARARLEEWTQAAVREIEHFAPGAEMFVELAEQLARREV